MLQQVVLVDGSADPIVLNMVESERKSFIAQGRAGNTPRNFKYSHMIDKVAVYRLDGELKETLADSIFLASAKAEADKLLHPEKYKDMGKQGALSNSERDELERLRKQVGGK